MKTTKELLELMLANPDEFRNGMCSWIMSLYIQNLISDGEYELIKDYITRNRPSIRYPRYFNRIYSNASEIAAKGDYPFSELVREAGKRYEKGPRSQGTATKVPAGTEVTINKVIPGELFINDGATVLKFTCSNELTGKLLSAETVTVNPGNSTPVPKGYTTIVVLNVSADTTGSFIVKLKK